MKKLVCENLSEFTALNEVNKPSNLDENDLNFINYVCDYYAFDNSEEKGTYSSHFSDKLSCQMVKDAYIKWYKKYPNIDINTREAFKAWLWELYPDIVEGECEYDYHGLIKQHKNAKKEVKQREKKNAAEEKRLDALMQPNKPTKKEDDAVYKIFKEEYEKYGDNGRYKINKKTKDYLGGNDSGKWVYGDINHKGIKDKEIKKFIQENTEEIFDKLKWYTEHGIPKKGLFFIKGTPLDTSKSAAPMYFSTQGFNPDDPMAYYASSQRWISVETIKKLSKLPKSPEPDLGTSIGYKILKDYKPELITDEEIKEFLQTSPYKNWDTYAKKISELIEKSEKGTLTFFNVDTQKDNPPEPKGSLKGIYFIRQHPYYPTEQGKLDWQMSSSPDESYKNFKSRRFIPIKKLKELL